MYLQTRQQATEDRLEQTFCTTDEKRCFGKLHFLSQSEMKNLFPTKTLRKTNHSHARWDIVAVKFQV